jgi:hypothetical protein
LTDPGAPIEVCEVQEVKSSGDTSYTALAPLGDDRYLLSWYSSPVDQELPWFQGISSPSDIWLADVDLDRAPEACVSPPPDRGCEPPPLPADTSAFDVTGKYLLTFAPVIWPAQPVFFAAEARVHGTSLDLTLEPLDAKTLAPLGAPWGVTGVAIAADGSFIADFGTRAVPVEAYPLLNDPFLTLHELTLLGKTTSPDSFCGNVGGYAQIFGDRTSDRVRLEGTTFGTTRFSDSTPPAAASSCS